MATVIEHRKFVFCRGAINSNKCWEVILYDNDDVEVRYGRVGANMQSKTHSGAGRRKMESLIRSKTKPKDHYDGGCYKEVATLESGEAAVSAKAASKTELKSIATKQIATCPITTKLVTFFTDVNAHNIHKATGGQITYDTSAGTFKTPIGIITSDGIVEARGVLDKITDMIAKATKSKKKKFGAKFDETVEALLMLVPQAVPRKFVPQELIGDIAAVQKQSDILDGLAASVQAVMSTPKGGKKKAPAKQPQLFNVRLTAEGDKAVLNEIKKFFATGLRRGHQSSGLKLRHAYAIDMPTMQKAWDLDGAKMKNIMKLWHGTKSSNLLSILKSGFYIPPSTASHVCGRAYGNGVYFSGSSTKSLNYAMNYWGGSDEGRYFMFYNLVAMGKYFVPRRTFSGGARAGYDSTYDKGDGKVFQNSEMIVYRCSQILPTHLVEFS